MITPVAVPDQLLKKPGAPKTFSDNIAFEELP